MPADDTARCRLAICDDVDSFRKALSLVFELEPGIEIVGEASNGREAIDLVGDVEVDVLLLDLAMPIMDGLEALPEIRRSSPDTRVVMLTGFGSPAIRERVMAEGASGFLQKGLAPDEIVDAVRGVCAD